MRARRPQTPAGLFAKTQWEAHNTVRKRSMRLASPSTPDHHGDGHEDAAKTDVGAQSLSYPGGFPEDSHEPLLVVVHEGREDGVHVGARADQEEDDEEKRLEIEERRHLAGPGGLAWSPTA